jgi:hypothetical protein
MNPLKIDITETEVRVSGIACGEQGWPIYGYANHRYSFKAISIKNAKGESVTVDLSGDYPERIIKAYSFLGIE